MSDFRGDNRDGLIAKLDRFIKIATAGFPFTNVVDVFESQTLGLRQASELTIKPVEIEDVTKRKIPMTYQVEGKIPLLQTDIPALRNAYLWSQSPVQAQIRRANGNYLNFVENTGGVGSPNGSCLLGLAFDYQITAKERKLEIMLDGVLYRLAFTWLQDNVGAASTGGSGGTELGITAMGYDRTTVRTANIGEVIIGGDSVGYFKDDVKISIKSNGLVVSPGYTLAQNYEVSAEVTLLQTGAPDVKAMIDAAHTDLVVDFVTLAGETFRFTNPGQSFEVKYSENDDRGAKLSISGEWPKNADEETPNSIDFGVTDDDIVEFKSLWS